MGVSTNGQICFGILFEDGYEFPWDGEPFEGDFDEWWLVQNGYKEIPGVWDEKGNQIGTEEEVKSYFAHKRKFDKEHPPPVTLVDYCSCDYPMYILAVPSSERVNHRGYPRAFNPSDLQVSPKEVDALLKFCKDFGIKPEIDEDDKDGDDGKPKWWLSSYWG